MMLDMANWIAQDARHFFGMIVFFAFVTFFIVTIIAALRGQFGDWL